MTALPLCEVSPATVGTVEDWRQQHPSWLYSALLTGHLRHHEQITEDWPLDDVLPGRLPLPSGRLVVGDPYLVEPDHAPLERPLPRGEHEVLVARARVAAGRRRNAAALLITGERPITTWEAPPTGCEVGAATACFADVGALSALVAAVAEDEDPLSRALDADDPDAPVVCAPPATGAVPVAAFGSGWGEGTYPIWLGLAADGSVSVVMVDFLLARDPWTREEPRGEEHTSIWKRLRRRT